MTFDMTYWNHCSLKKKVEEECKRSDMLKKQQFERDKDMIMRQMEERRRFKEREREENIIQDKIDMRRAQQRAKEEEESKLLKKMQQKAANEELRLQNEKDKERKMAEIRKLREIELKKEEEYRYATCPFEIFLTRYNDS